MLYTGTYVFFALVALDFVWAQYTYELQNERAWRASGYAAAIIVLSGGAAIGYVNDYRMLLPAMAGAFVGTFASVWWKAGKRA